MRVGRPPLGAAHVDSLEGSPVVKERLRAILESLTGAVTVEEVCERLGIERSRFHELRVVALQAALDGLAPRPLGRPRKVLDSSVREARLERRIGELELELAAERVRSEMALVMPQLLSRTQDAPPGAKQLARSRAKRRGRGTRRG